MTCSEFKMRLDEFLDGELPRTEATTVEEHAASCAACNNELGESRRILEEAAGLARSVKPAGDLWPGIAARLEPRSNVAEGRFGRRLGPWVAIAAMVVVVVGTVVIAYTVGRQQARPVVVQRQAAPLAVPARVEGGSAAAVEAEFLEARDELMSALEQRQGTLSPETLEVVWDNMRVIDAAIERITAALDEDPGNLMLASQLTTVYQRQIRLLRRANRLPAQV